MKLIRDMWLPFLDLQHELVKGLLPAQDKAQMTQAADFYTTDFFMRVAKTIVIPSTLMMELMQSVDKVDCIGVLHLPYAATLIQFTNPIPEQEIMPHVEVPTGIERLDKDSIQGFLLCNPYQGHALATDMRRVYDKIAMNSIALFSSTAVARVAWLDPGERKAKPSWSDMALPIERWRQENKTRLMRVAYLIDLFLNAPNVTVELIRHDEKVNRKRVAKGKARLPEYHVVSIKKLQGVYASASDKGQGTEHSHMYPVRGHFRRYKHLAKPVWIPNHYRGLRHGFESLRPGVYTVKSADVDTKLERKSHE